MNDDSLETDHRGYTMTRSKSPKSTCAAPPRPRPKRLKRPSDEQSALQEGSTTISRPRPNVLNAKPSERRRRRRGLVSRNWDRATGVACLTCRMSKREVFVNGTWASRPLLPYSYVVVLGV